MGHPPPKQQIWIYRKQVFTRELNSIRFCCDRVSRERLSAVGYLTCGRTLNPEFWRENSDGWEASGLVGLHASYLMSTTTLLFGSAAPLNSVSQRVRDFLRNFGTPIPEFPADPATGKFSAIVGSGHLNLNPTILHVQVSSAEGFPRVWLRAVAKEGAVKQDTAKKLVERIENLFTRESSD